MSLGHPHLVFHHFPSATGFVWLCLEGTPTFPTIFPEQPRLTEFKTWMAEHFPSPEVACFEKRQVTQTLKCLVEFDTDTDFLQT